MDGVEGWEAVELKLGLGLGFLNFLVILIMGFFLFLLLDFAREIVYSTFKMGSWKAIPME